MRFKYINKIFLYKCFFLIYTIFLTTEFSQMKNFAFLKIFIYGGGMLLLAYEVYKSKGKYLTKNKFILIFMCLSVITIFVNRGFVDNFKFYLLTLIQMFLLNSVDKKNGIEESKDEFRKINFIFIFMTSIFTCMGIIMKVFDINILNIPIIDAGRINFIKGVYIISTTAGLACYLSLSSTLIALINYKKQQKCKCLIVVFYMFNIVIQIYGLLLSRARGSLIAFIAFFIILLFLFTSKKSMRVGIIISLIAIIMAFPIYKTELLNTKFLNKNSGGNFFNGRMILWENGYKYAFGNHKILGTGAGNTVSIIKESSNDELPGIDGGRLHNIYIDVLCSNGILGFSIFILFLISFIVKLYKFSFNEKLIKSNRIFIKPIFAIISSILVINMVESIMIYVVSLASTLFWIYAGYANKIISSNTTN